MATEPGDYGVTIGPYIPLFPEDRASNRVGRASWREIFVEGAGLPKDATDQQIVELFTRFALKDFSAAHEY